MLLICLYPLALALEEGEIAQPSMPVPNMQMPTPKITAPNMNAPDSGSALKSTESASAAPQINGSGQATGTQATSEEEEEADPVSGKWSVRFEELRDRSLDLTLWKSGREMIMGYGTLISGGDETAMTATGSLDGQDLSLSVRSADVELGGQSYSQYDFIMRAENGTLQGSYMLTEGELQAGSGNATGMMR